MPEFKDDPVFFKEAETPAVAHVASRYSLAGLVNPSPERFEGGPWAFDLAGLVQTHRSLADLAQSTLASDRTTAAQLPASSLPVVEASAPYRGLSVVPKRSTVANPVAAVDPAA